LESEKFSLPVYHIEKNNICLFFILLLFQITISAQTKLDSLYSVWQDQNKPDSTRAIALEDYIYEESFNSQPDSAIVLANRLYEFTKEKGYDRGTVDALILRGYVFFRTGNYPKAFSSYKEGLEIAENINYKLGAADILLRTGYIYHDNEDVINALKNYERSLKIYKELDDLDGIGTVYNEFGSIYLAKGDHEKALDYYLKSIANNEGLDDEMANTKALLKKNAYSIRNTFGKRH
jgi:tetratricopeptide (TPR) repeat protein